MKQTGLVEIAFLADRDMPDIYGSLSDNNSEGISNSGTNKYVLIRRMASELQSSRVFYENNSAFIRRWTI